MQSIKAPAASNSKNLSQQKLRVFMKWAGLISSAFWLALIPHLARAEGTKELTSSGGYRPWTMYQSTGQYFGISYKTIAKVYAKSGETIYAGSRRGFFSVLTLKRSDLVQVLKIAIHLKCSDLVHQSKTV